MGRSAKTGKRKESWSRDGVTSGAVEGISRATPPVRSSRATPGSNSKALLSTPASPSSSDAPSEIVAEIVVRTDDMDATSSATGNGEGGEDMSVAAEYVM